MQQFPLKVTFNVIDITGRNKIIQNQVKHWAEMKRMFYAFRWTPRSGSRLLAWNFLNIPKERKKSPHF